MQICYALEKINDPEICHVLIITSIHDQCAPLDFDAHKGPTI